MLKLKKQEAVDQKTLLWKAIVRLSIVKSPLLNHDQALLN